MCWQNAWARTACGASCMRSRPKVPLAGPTSTISYRLCATSAPRNLIASNCCPASIDEASRAVTGPGSAIWSGQLDIGWGGWQPTGPALLADIDQPAYDAQV